MKQLTDFMNKWGATIMVLFGLMIFMNTCGVKGRMLGIEKRQTNLEQTIQYNDSLNREYNLIQGEIKMYETAREVVYTSNAIVRTTVRPDDVMNQYSNKITELQAKAEKIRNAKK